MPSIDFEVFCAECGEGLCGLTSVGDRNGVKLTVGPCPKCLEGSKEEGYESGYEKGYEKGMEESEAM